MELNCFAEKVKVALQKEFGEGYNVIVQEVEKNNGVTQKGLTILAGDRNISPTIYLEPFWEAYEEGMPLSEVTQKIQWAYQRDMPAEDVDMSFFRNLSKVRDKICFRLIHRASNEKLLEQIPYIPFLDLAICFHYLYTTKELGTGTILIRNSHLEVWQTDVATLYELAKENTPHLLPAEEIKMEDLIGELFGCDIRTGEADLADSIPMVIISNVNRSYGAACMLYPGLLEKMAGRLQGGFYILPSSIHEIILLQDGPTIWAKQLKEMIREINRTELKAEEKLSDSLYYYDSEKHCVKKI